MRCPHCSSHKARPPTCGACGKAIDAAPHLPLAAEIEHTRASPAQVDVRRPPEIEATGSAPVEVALPPKPAELLSADEELGRAPAKPRKALAVERTAANERVTCSLCSVPNPAGREICRACGHRL